MKRSAWTTLFTPEQSAECRQAEGIRMRPFVVRVVGALALCLARIPPREND